MTNRIAIFAHFDKDNIIDNYVIFYLKELKKVCEKIIFVSACNLSEDEKSKLNGITDNIIAQKHDEYDFGSYKRGFNYFLDKHFDAEELLFANDSCYGPLFPLSEVFDKIEKEPCDFWGISENLYDTKGRKQQHIQSYFIVFKKQIFENTDFIEFFKDVKSEKQKNNIVQKYEVGLSKTLFEKRFIAKTYLKKYKEFGNPTIYAWRELLQERLSPFVKCSILRLQNTRETTVENWEEEILKYNYDINLIKNNLKRLHTRAIKRNASFKLKTKYFRFYRNKKHFLLIKKGISFLMQYLYSTIFD